MILVWAGISLCVVFAIAAIICCTALEKKEWRKNDAPKVKTYIQLGE